MDGLLNFEFASHHCGVYLYHCASVALCCVECINYWRSSVIIDIYVYVLDEVFLDLFCCKLVFGFFVECGKDGCFWICCGDVCVHFLDENFFDVGKCVVSFVCCDVVL